MTTVQKIINYCQEPRTAKEITAHLGMNKDTIYSHLNNLQRAGMLDKRGDGRRRVEPARFIVTRQAPKATESSENYENLVLTYAHNPFGLKNGIAQEIR
jgi:predicted ArsR family transcriptional regulator